MTRVQTLVIAACGAWLLTACGGDDGGSGGDGGDCGLVTDPAVGPIMCGCGAFGGEDQTTETCDPALLGGQALCIDRPEVDLCDCRAYICRTRMSSGVCSCSVGAYESTEGETYTDGCTTTTGVCCLENTSCECGHDECGPSSTQVDDCESDEVLDAIAEEFLSAGGGTRRDSCSD